MQDTELPEKIEPTSLNLQTELAAQLAELVPEAMSDGKLDVTKLRELVNGDAENSPEKFGLFWPGKRAAQALAQIPTTATLVPAPDESVDWDTTKNIFIEGDNLEVLKALQNSYRRKVKMIYIDPPYNTGNEFIYPDKFSEGLQGYLEYTGQRNAEGEIVESKKETGGRKHSNWLSMMYPRLQLAKSLLRDDGVMFISIGDDEVVELSQIVKDVFSENNFLGVVPRISKTTSDSGDFFAPSIDYVLVAARNADSLDQFKQPLSESDIKAYTRQDAKGKYKTVGFYQASLTLERSRNARYFIEAPDGTQVIPPENKRWRTVKETYLDFLEKDEIVFIEVKNSPLIDENGNQAKWNVYTKQYLERRAGEGRTPRNFIADFPNVIGTKEIKSLGLPFDFPKPTGLIAYLATICGVSSNDIVLDFFSGSATTAHAIMNKNIDDSMQAYHIQVQLPEKTLPNSDAFNMGFKTISDISKERIRRAAKKIREDYSDKIAQRNTPLDTGFRVYKLAPSNFVQWDENKAKDDIQQSVLDFAANKKPEAAPESLLTEIMLQARMPLSANIEKRDLQNGGWVYVVDGGNLIAYVADEQITEAQANEIADLAPAKLIVLDSAFNGNNALKINVMNICKEKFIKEFKTI